MAKLRTQEGKTMARNMDILFGVYLHGYFHAQKNDLSHFQANYRRELMVLVLQANYRRELMVLVQAFSAMGLIDSTQFDGLNEIMHGEGF